MKTVRLKGIIGSTYLIIYYISDTIYGMNVNVGNEYYLISNIIQIIGLLIYLSSIRLILKNCNIKRNITTKTTNILISVLLLNIGAKFIVYFLGWIEFGSFVNFVSLMVSLVLSIGILTMKNRNQQNVKNIRSIFTIYLIILLIILVLTIFKVDHLIIFQRQLLFLFLAIPFIYSLFVFFKNEFDSKDKNKTNQTIEIESREN